jgi:hypothetical protein
MGCRNPVSHNLPGSAEFVGGFSRIYTEIDGTRGSLKILGINRIGHPDDGAVHYHLK